MSVVSCKSSCWTPRRTACGPTKGKTDRGMRRRGRTTPTGPLGATRSHLNSQSRGCTYVHVCSLFAVSEKHHPCCHATSRRDNTSTSMYVEQAPRLADGLASLRCKRYMYGATELPCFSFFVLFCSFSSLLFSSLLLFCSSALFFSFHQLPRQRQQPQRQQPPTCVIIPRRSSFLQVTNDLDRTKSNSL